MNRLVLSLAVFLALLGMVGGASAQSTAAQSPAAPQCGANGVFEGNKSIGEFLCICLPGFGGLHCDKTIAPVCSGNGVLHDKKCVCEAGFSGDQCDAPKAMECSNQGILEHPDDPATSACRCLPGRGGDQCQFDEATQCLGHGVVLGSGPQKNTCLCKSGYGGERCESGGQAANPLLLGCGDNGIKEHGCHCLPGSQLSFSDSGKESCLAHQEPVCSGNGVHGTSGKCECLPGFSGEKCEIAHAVCNGHGVVEGSSKDSYCHCVSGYGGDQCQFDIASQCGGHGIIRSSGHQKNECTCVPGYSGEHCEQVCGGHGDIGSNGVCTCEAGYQSNLCNIPIKVECGGGKLINGACQCPAGMAPQDGKCRKPAAKAEPAQKECEERGAAYIYDRKKGADGCSKCPPGREANAKRSECVAASETGSKAKTDALRAKPSLNGSQPGGGTPDSGGQTYRPTLDPGIGVRATTGPGLQTPAGLHATPGPGVVTPGLHATPGPGIQTPPPRYKP